MQFLLLGATGRTGHEVLTQALATGHAVVAYVRSPHKLRLTHPRLVVVQGELANKQHLQTALQGCQAVISTLGATSGGGSSPSQALPGILDAMRARGIRRYIGISSGAATRLPTDRKPLPARIVGWFLRTFQAQAAADKQAELDLLRSATGIVTDIDWTLARPTRLLNRPATGQIRPNAHRPHRLWVARADVAAFLLSQLTDTRWLHQAPFVS